MMSARISQFWRSLFLSVKEIDYIESLSCKFVWFFFYKYSNCLYVLSKTLRPPSEEVGYPNEMAQHPSKSLFYQDKML